MELSCADRVLVLDQPVVMGVLNVTPDSFSDGGHYLHADAALAHAERIAAEGAAIIDIGGESTRPGSAGIDSEEELRRVLPVVERVAARLPLLISIDTSNPQLMRRAAAAGAHMINDVRSLRVAGAMEALAASTLGVCLMHMRGEPADMQLNPQYTDVVGEVRSYLAARVQACLAAGIARARLAVDPGFGFGKALAHNLELLRRLAEFRQLALPLAVGLSRKSMVAALSAAAPGAERGAGGLREQRLAGSVALATIAVLQGAQIVRAHDVAATVDAVRIASVFKPVASSGGVDRA
jgi:dihydropteroate synthase